MREIIITEDIVKYWRYLHRNAIWTPHKPYCKLCSVISRYRSKRKINYLKVGDKAIRIDFTNNTHALYHPECIAKLSKDAYLFKLDRDRWQSLQAFINTLREKGLTNAQLVREIVREYECSRATAYRKIVLLNG